MPLVALRGFLSGARSKKKKIAKLEKNPEKLRLVTFLPILTAVRTTQNLLENIHMLQNSIQKYSPSAYIIPHKNACA